LEDGILDESFVYGDERFLLFDDGLSLDGKLGTFDLHGGFSEEGAHEASPLGLGIVVGIKDPDVVLIVVSVVSNGHHALALVSVFSDFLGDIGVVVLNSSKVVSFLNEVSLGGNREGKGSGSNEGLHQ